MSEQNKQVVREYYDRVLNGRDLEAVGDFFVDERLVEGVKGGCFRYFEAFPDLHIALDDVIAEGDRVFVRSTMTGTHDGEYKGIPPTRRHVAAESASSSASRTGGSSATGASQTWRGSCANSPRVAAATA